MSKKDISIINKNLFQKVSVLNYINQKQWSIHGIKGKVVTKI